MPTKRTTITTADRLRHPCPTCNVKAGDRCIDPKGDATARPHKTRGPGQLEAHKAKEAERINARQLASYGPLFQEVASSEVRPVTAAELIERDRHAATLAFDRTCDPLGLELLRQCNKGMEWVFLHYIARELERMAGDVGRTLADHCIHTYPLDYQRMIFAEIMTTTKRKEVGPYRVEAANSMGFRIAYRHTWEPAVPLMTRDEFDARFPRPDHWKGLADEPEPDDGGLFERTIGRLITAA